MKKGFSFGCLFVASMIFVCLCFNYAGAFRGYFSIGSELFLLPIPILIVWKKIAEFENKMQRLKRENLEYRKILNQ